MICLETADSIDFVFVLQLKREVLLKIRRFRYFIMFNKKIFRKCHNLHDANLAPVAGRIRLPLSLPHYSSKTKKNTTEKEKKNKTNQVLENIFLCARVISMQSFKVSC